MKHKHKKAWHGFTTACDSRVWGRVTKIAGAYWPPA